MVGMTTTLDVPVAPASPPPQTAPEDSDLEELRVLEQRSDRRDNWTVMMFGIAVVALLFSMVAVGLALRATDDSKRQVRTAVAPAPAPVSLTSVTLSDMKVMPSSTDVPAGKYNVTITNAGSMEHELLVFHTDIAAADIPVGADGKVAEDAPGFKISDGDNIDPGASQSRVIDLSQPGTYLFVCNLPGHFMAGMHTTVTVK
jgi:uncharacterized cupredoxin-like copper-binding protein